MTKRLVPAKEYFDVNEKKKQIARELGAIEKAKISLPELNRRIISIPNLDRVLKSDAEFKRRFKK